MIGVLWLEIHFLRGDEFFWLALNGWWLTAEKRALHFAPTVWVISVQMTIERLLKSLDVCVTVLVIPDAEKKKKDIIYPLQASKSWVSMAELSEASFWIYALLRYLRLLPLCSSSRQGLAVTWPHGLSCCSPVGTDVCFCKCLELFKVRLLPRLFISACLLASFAAWMEGMSPAPLPVQTCLGLKGCRRFLCKHKITSPSMGLDGWKVICAPGETRQRELHRRVPLPAAGGHVAKGEALSWGAGEGERRAACWGCWKENFLPTLVFPRRSAMPACQERSLHFVAQR